MNKVQKIIVALTLSLVALMCLVPPWRVTMGETEDGRSTGRSFHWYEKNPEPPLPGVRYGALWVRCWDNFITDVETTHAIAFRAFQDRQRDEENKRYDARLKLWQQKHPPFYLPSTFDELRREINEIPDSLLPLDLRPRTESPPPDTIKVKRVRSITGSRVPLRIDRTLLALQIIALCAVSGVALVFTKRHN